MGIVVLHELALLSVVITKDCESIWVQILRNFSVNRRIIATIFANSHV